MKGKRGPRPQSKERKAKANGEAVADELNTQSPAASKKSGIPPRAYQCEECEFKGTLEELTEHQAGEKHTGWAEAEAEQTELFAETGVVHRTDRVPLADGYLNEVRKEVCDLYIEAAKIRAQKQAAVDGFNLQLKAIDSKADPLLLVLVDPFDEQPVECEWKVDTDNPTERILMRLDNRTIIDRKPLTAEERAQLEQRAIEIPY